MKWMKLLLLVSVAAYTVSSCKKEDDLGNVDNIPGLGGDTTVSGPIDKWIYDTLTVPYNISVKYKWDQFELDLDKTIVPVREEKVIPVMSAIKKIWTEPYIAEAGLVFFKRFSPKEFTLAGSSATNPDGSAKLGTAEGGRKILLYQMNYFRTKGMTGFVPSDSNIIKTVFHTIEHEFGHILHQNILYPPEFKRIGQSLYTSDWINTTDEEARKDGFITAYAMSQPDDDFVDMIATMLVEGKAGFDKIVNGIPAGVSINGTTDAEAKSRLRSKEAIVVNYYKQVWNIDFYSLQSRTRAAISSLLY